jgi:hypothetical protein
MGMEKIIISKRVKYKLSNLALTLYQKEYFGFEDSAQKYVDKIVLAILSIPTLKHSKTKNPKVGKWFVRHKPNKQTTYYITFDRKDRRYLVKDLITNHEPAYRTAIS